MSSKPTFENDWFEKDAKIKFEKHLLPIADTIDSYLEIGVCCGASMLWVLENLKPKYADGVDWWRTGLKVNEKRDKVFQQYKENAYHNLGEYTGDCQAELHEMSSKRFMANCERKYDLIYIDGDHSGNGCMRDLILAYELLKEKTHKRELSTGVEQAVGGIIVIDDLQRSTSKKGRYECRLSWDAFLMLMMGRMRLLWEDGRQAAAIRIG